MFPVNAFRATLGKAVRIFQRFEIRFHLTGGIASVYYGEPRLTQDIDIVIDNAQAAAPAETVRRNGGRSATNVVGAHVSVGGRR